MTDLEYGDYAEDILSAITAIEEFVHGLNFAAFTEDRKTIFAVVRAIEIIGEATPKKTFLRRYERNTLKSLEKDGGNER